MPGIANLTTDEFRARIERFDRRYLADWDAWLKAVQKKQNVASEFGQILRRWQACRPNRMRRSRYEAQHDAPFLEDLIAASTQHVQVLVNFDIRNETSYTAPACDAIRGLWDVFVDLSYCGEAHQGKAGVVGISKAVLLLTEGRVGPAFDSQVRKRIHIQEPLDAEGWLQALKLVTRDIAAFEQRNECTMQEATPGQFRQYRCGRIYDMALGPGIRTKSVHATTEMRHVSH